MKEEAVEEGVLEEELLQFYIGQVLRILEPYKRMAEVAVHPE